MASKGRNPAKQRAVGVRDKKAAPTLAFIEDCTKVFKLRAVGMSFREIGRQLDIAPATAHRRYYAVLEQARPDPETIQEVRCRQLAEVTIVREQMLRNVVKDSDVKAAGVLDQLWRHELALLGVRPDDFTAPAAGRDVDASTALKDAVSQQILAAQLAALNPGDTDDDVADAEMVDG